MLKLYPIICDFCGYEMLTDTPAEASEPDGTIECGACKQVDSARMMDGEDKYSVANEASEVWKSVYHNEWQERRAHNLGLRKVRDILYDLIDKNFIPEKPTPFEEAVGLKDGRHGEYEIIRGGDGASLASPGLAAPDGLTSENEAPGHDEAPIQTSTKPPGDSPYDAREKQIINAMRSITRSDCKFTRKGKPYVRCVSDILGFKITKKERNAAWRKTQ